MGGAPSIEDFEEMSRLYRHGTLRTLLHQVFQRYPTHRKAMIVRQVPIRGIGVENANMDYKNSHRTESAY